MSKAGTLARVVVSWVVLSGIAGCEAELDEEEFADQAAEEIRFDLYPGDDVSAGILRVRVQEPGARIKGIVDTGYGTAFEVEVATEACPAGHWGRCENAT